MHMDVSHDSGLGRMWIRKKEEAFIVDKNWDYEYIKGNKIKCICVWEE